MIELFFGTDTDAITTALERSVHILEREGFSKKKISGNDYNENEILDELLCEDLFSSKQLFVISEIMKFPHIIKRLCEWHEYDHPTKKIILRETAVPAVYKKDFKKAGILLYEYKKVPTKDSRIFQLTEYLCSRNVKQFWIQYRILLDDGVSVHQMLGMLWWQMKTMLLVAQSQINPGLVPFVYTKAKKAIQKYTHEELHTKTKELLAIYHQGHAGDNMEMLLEKFILTL